MKQLKNNWLTVLLLFGLIVPLYSCDDDDDDNQPINEVVFDNIELTGVAEVQNPPVVTDGSGVLNAVYDQETNIITYEVDWTLGDPDDQTIGMHFHGPASPTANAPVVIAIPLPNDNPAGSVSGQTRPLTEAEENDLLNGLWYLNIHSNTFPAGELRGQLD